MLIIPSFEPTLRIIINTSQVRAMWRALDGFHDKSSHQREVVDSVLHGQADEHAIDGKDIVFQVQCMYSVCDQGNALYYITKMEEKSAAAATLLRPAESI